MLTQAVSGALCPWESSQEGEGGGRLCNSVSSPCVRPCDGKDEPCDASSPSRTRKASALLASGVLGSMTVAFKPVLLATSRNQNRKQMK